MLESCTITSPVGTLYLEADEIGLRMLSFVGETLKTKQEEITSPVLKEVLMWLRSYFAGECPEKLPPLHLEGTEFQMAVWTALLHIPYGETVSYGMIASELSKARGGKRVAAQAVGGAVGRNPVAIIVPCHRVVGSTGALTGFSAGLDKKIALLKHEGVVLTENNQAVWKEK